MSRRKAVHSLQRTEMGENFCGDEWSSPGKKCKQLGRFAGVAGAGVGEPGGSVGLAELLDDRVGEMPAVGEQAGVSVRQAQRRLLR